MRVPSCRRRCWREPSAGADRLSPSAGEFAGLVADEDAVDDGADGVLFVGVEVGDGLEAELPVVGGVFVGVEDEPISVGVEREGESADDVEGGLGCALFVSADLADVDADLLSEGLLGEALLVAEGGESFGEVHGVHVAALFLNGVNRPVCCIRSGWVWGLDVRSGFERSSGSRTRRVGCRRVRCAAGGC